jgi:3-deoxy-D-manno-octulosonic-acid transferase
MSLHNGPIITGIPHKLYTAIGTLALPLIVAALGASKRGRRRFLERFGSWDLDGEIDCWLHGASVGEVQGLIPFIESLKERGTSRMLLTSTSPTGLDRGATRVSETRLLPVDLPFLLRHALAKIEVKRFVLSETELWPNLLVELQRREIACHLINGRISDYTIKWYSGLANIFSPILRRFHSISVPDDEQRARFLELGVDAFKVHVTGHTKYDVAPRFKLDDGSSELRESFFPGIDKQTPILTLGSLRYGEEQLWFSAIKRAWDGGAKLKVIVAPRHAERFEDFWRALNSLGRPAARWSSRVPKAQNDKQHQVLLLDTLGVLEEAYAASDLAFVGATLVNIGGHNPFEPAMYRVPTVVGPYISVIREPVALMRRNGGIIELSSGSDEELDLVISRLVKGDNQLTAIGQAGYAAWVGCRGAVARVLTVINS